MKKFFLILLLQFSVSVISLAQPTRLAGIKAPQPVVHPQWAMQGNIYEVNIRQYTQEGTLNAFAKHLDRLKKMGVQTLWFMPINPISKVDRKGSLGSYYAVAEYTTLNPEYGTMKDWQALVKAIHARGMKVIIDWVPNHTGADNGWITRHPDFFVKDSSGKPAVAFDWADVRQLDYKNKEMQDSMIAAMKFWVVKTGIDGFRCDVASNVPGSFWSRCIHVLKKEKDVFMLAEGDSSFLIKSGFDAVYPWHMFWGLQKIVKGEYNALAIDSLKNESDRKFPRNTLQMYFTSNHDENSWNKSDYETFPGDAHAPFAVFTQTMVNSIPLIYTGQEEPVLRAIKFFDKDPVTFEKLARASFYKTLLDFRKRNPALSADASFTKVNVGDDTKLYAYLREKDGNKVLVVLNLSPIAQPIDIKDKSLAGKARNIFSGKKEIAGIARTLPPWGYLIYEYDKK